MFNFNKLSKVTLSQTLGGKVFADSNNKVVMLLTDFLAVFFKYFNMMLLKGLKFGKDPDTNYNAAVIKNKKFYSRLLSDIKLLTKTWKRYEINDYNKQLENPLSVAEDKRIPADIMEIINNIKVVKWPKGWRGDNHSYIAISPDRKLLLKILFTGTSNSAGRALYDTYITFSGLERIDMDDYLDTVNYKNTAEYKKLKKETALFKKTLKKETGILIPVNFNSKFINNHVVLYFDWEYVGRKTMPLTVTKFLRKIFYYYIKWHRITDNDNSLVYIHASNLYYIQVTWENTKGHLLILDKDTYNYINKKEEYADNQKIEINYLFDYNKKRRRNVY